MRMYLLCFAILLNAPAACTEEVDPPPFANSTELLWQVAPCQRVISVPGNTTITEEWTYVNGVATTVSDSEGNTSTIEWQDGRPVKITNNLGGAELIVAQTFNANGTLAAQRITDKDGDEIERITYTWPANTERFAVASF